MERTKTYIYPPRLFPLSVEKLTEMPGGTVRRLTLIPMNNQTYKVTLEIPAHRSEEEAQYSHALNYLWKGNQQLLVDQKNRTVLLSASQSIPKEFEDKGKLKLATWQHDQVDRVIMRAPGLEGKVSIGLVEGLMDFVTALKNASALELAKESQNANKVKGARVTLLSGSDAQTKSLSI